MSPQSPLAPEALPRFRPDQPVLWRRQGTVQCGPAIVERVTSADVAWVIGLDGRLNGAQVKAACPGTSARRLLHAAVAAGAIEDARLTSDALRWTPADGRARVLGDLAAATHAHLDPAQAIRLIDRRLSTSVAVLGDGMLADLLRTLIPACGLSLAVGSRASVTVLAERGHPHASAGPSTGEHLGPHLPVRAYAAMGVCGPLVVPGLTPCLRCHDLHRRDADPAWPLIGVQWAQCADRQAPIDSLLAHHLAGLTVSLLRRWIDEPDSHEQWSCLAYALCLPDLVTEIEERPAHPLCGCQWDALARTS
ncbi:MAG: hypothetical protein ACR2JS_02260 [Candidatus Nanopelagicales bacterium]